MIRFGLSLLAIALITTGLVVGAVYLVPATVPGWLPEYSLRESSDIKELAFALSTPPTHLAGPTQYALYHWQTLIAGVLAFFGGLSALVAAYIGAQALREQTKEAQNAAVAAEIKQNTKQENEFNARKTQMAAALYAEAYEYIAQMKTFCGDFDGINELTDDICTEIVMNVVSDDSLSPIFDAVKGEIGILPVKAAIKTVEFHYKYVRVCRAIITIKNNMAHHAAQKNLDIVVANFIDRAISLTKTGDELLAILKENFPLLHDEVGLGEYTDIKQQ